jgi:hypothetical protein
MRNFVRSGLASTILTVPSWILLLLIAFFYLQALMKEPIWLDSGRIRERLRARPVGNPEYA